MLSLAAKLEAVSKWTGYAIAWLTLLMVVITFMVVILRYLFNLGWISMQESVSYLHAINFMLGAAFTLKQDSHVRVDIFYQKFGPRGRAWVDLLGTLFLLLPVCGFIFWSSLDYVSASWAVGESSGEAGGLAWVYLLKSLLLLMPLLLLIQGGAWLLKNAHILLTTPATSGKRGGA